MFTQNWSGPEAFSGFMAQHTYLEPVVGTVEHQKTALTRRSLPSQGRLGLCCGRMQI